MKISERAKQILAISDFSQKECLVARCIGCALDEWQASVEDRLAKLEAGTAVDSNWMVMKGGGTDV